MIKINDKLYVNNKKVIYVRRDGAGFPEMTTNPQACINRFNRIEDGWYSISEETFNLLIKEK